MLALLTNIVVLPTFNLNEFKEKGVVIDEIKQQNDQPEERLYNYFLGRVWLCPSYANSILGTESIKNLGINDLERFHSKHYNSERICIAIAGNLSEDVYKDFKNSDLSAETKKHHTVIQIV